MPIPKARTSSPDLNRDFSRTWSRSRYIDQLGRDSSEPGQRSYQLLGPWDTGLLSRTKWQEAFPQPGGQDTSRALPSKFISSCCSLSYFRRRSVGRPNNHPVFCLKPLPDSERRYFLTFLALSEDCKQLSESFLVGLANRAGAIRFNPIGILITQGVEELPLELSVGSNLVVRGLVLGSSTVP